MVEGCGGGLMCVLVGIVVVVGMGWCVSCENGQMDVDVIARCWIMIYLGVSRISNICQAFLACSASLNGVVPLNM